MTDALNQFLDSVRDEPFAWGEHDCAMFAARAVDAVRATNFADYVKTFKIGTAREFRKLQREGVTLRALTTAQLGEPLEGEFIVLERGDVVLVRGGSGDSLGIAVPPVVLVATGRGFAPLPMSTVVDAWRIT